MIAKSDMSDSEDEGIQKDGRGISLSCSERQARDKLFQFLMFNCKPLMPKWLFTSITNDAHLATGDHPSLSHLGNIDAGAFGMVHKVCNVIFGS
jgi:hypothetical protein